jgi:hypothetical protein
MERYEDILQLKIHPLYFINCRKIEAHMLLKTSQGGLIGNLAACRMG